MVLHAIESLFLSHLDTDRSNTVKRRMTRVASLNTSKEINTLALHEHGSGVRSPTCIVTCVIID